MPINKNAGYCWLTHYLVVNILEGYIYSRRIRACNAWKSDQLSASKPYVWKQLKKKLSVVEDILYSVNKLEYIFVKCIFINVGGRRAILTICQQKKITQIQCMQVRIYAFKQRLLVQAVVATYKTHSYFCLQLSNISGHANWWVHVWYVKGLSGI